MSDSMVIMATAEGRIWGTSEGRDALRQLGVATLEDVRRFEGGEVVIAGRHRTVRRLTGPDGRALYLKQSFRGGGGEVLRGFLKSLRRASSSRREWDNIRLLNGAGIATGEPLAAGERLEGFSEAFSFLLTREAPGVALTDYLDGASHAVTRTPARDRAARVALVAALRRLFAAGIYLDDLAPKHLFLDFVAADAARLSLIDVPRLRRSRPHDARPMAICLARLGVEIPARSVSTTERIRFFRLVAGDRSSSLLSLVESETRRRVMKRRYRRNLLARLPRTTRPWERSQRGSVVYDPAHLDEFAVRGLDLERPELAHAALEAMAARDPGRVSSGPAGDVRTLFKLHDALHGIIRLVPLVACHLPPDDQDFAWLVTDHAPGVALSDVLRDAPPEVLLPLLRETRRCIEVIAFLGYRPGKGMLSWFTVLDGTILVRPRLPVSDLDSLDPADWAPLGEALHREALAAGLDPVLASRLAAPPSFLLPGLLGVSRRIL